jgi:hypothetical protein
MSSWSYQALKPALIRALVSTLGILALPMEPSFAQTPPDIMKATLSQQNDKTPEVSTGS